MSIRILRFISTDGTLMTIKSRYCLKPPSTRVFRFAKFDRRLDNWRIDVLMAFPVPDRSFTSRDSCRIHWWIDSRYNAVFGRRVDILPILRSIVKLILPKKSRDWLRDQHHRFVFRRAMKAFLMNPEKSIRPNNTTLNDLIYGWGNEFWSAQDEYLIASIRHAMTSDGPILECGSGLTTILVGSIAASRGHSHWALENSNEWADKVRFYLRKYNIDSVIMCCAPLKDYGDFTWYDPPLEKMPESFALVICDGPPGSTKGGRIGLGSVMRPQLKKDCVILLDDALRDEEIEIAKKWQKDFSASSRLIGQEKQHIELVVGGDDDSIVPN